MEQAYNLVRDTVSEGGTVLFVGTKRQAQETIQAEAMRSGMPYVTNRWLGGMLTNWRTMRQRINELERLERMRDTGEFERITKKEGLILSRIIERLDMLLGGIRSMVKLPDVVFVVDVMREETAIHEANILEIPVVGMVDTNCDPRDVDYVIPSNDDAIRAIKLMVGKIADAAVEGRAMRKEEEVEEAPMRAAYVEEPELADEELLGEATLAKLSTKVEAFADEIEEQFEEPVEEIEGEAAPEAEVEAEDNWQAFVKPAEEEAPQEEIPQEEAPQEEAAETKPEEAGSESGA